MATFAPSPGATLDASADDIFAKPLWEVSRSAWYMRHYEEAPDLLVIELPRVILRPSMPIGEAAHLVIFCETVADRNFAEKMMDVPLRKAGGCADLRLTIGRVMRPSKLPRSRQALLAHYAPPYEGWPHFVVIALPYSVRNEGFARDRYGYDIFPDFESAQGHLNDMRYQQAAECLRAGVLPNAA